MAARDASGPCYARALCQSLHRGEDYVLQFDSHMRLRQNWDTYLIQQHQRLVNQRGDDRVVLTTYPIGYTLPNRVPNETRGTLLVPWKFDDCGLLRQRGRLMNPRTDPVPSPLIAAGFFFGPAATTAMLQLKQFATTCGAGRTDRLNNHCRQVKRYNEKHRWMLHVNNYWDKKHLFNICALGLDLVGWYKTSGGLASRFRGTTFPARRRREWGPLQQ